MPLPKAESTMYHVPPPPVPVPVPMLMPTQPVYAGQQPLYASQQTMHGQFTPPPQYPRQKNRLNQSVVHRAFCLLVNKIKRKISKRNEEDGKGGVTILEFKFDIVPYN